MIGAIIGDIVGSRFEFHNTHDNNFAFITDKSKYTDDTICTVAIADAIMNRRCDYKTSLLNWCLKYPTPMGGYGAAFARWLASENHQPYSSFGNGAAMRVSPVGYIFKTEEEVLEEAYKTAAVSHSHTEGIKGAQAVALAIFRMRQTQDKNEADRTAKEFYGQDYAEHLIQPYVFDETCQGCVPLCLYIASHSDSFEDAIRKTILYGGDTDTTGAIVGSLAQAVFKIDTRLYVEAMKKLPEEFRDIVRQFNDLYVLNCAKYNFNTIDSEFRHSAKTVKFVNLLNIYYDDVKKLSIEKVKELLPINHHGYNGTYLLPWMFSECKATKHYPFTLTAKIYDWYGDRSTTAIVEAAANTEEELYHRLLMQYILYLNYYIEYEEAAKEFSTIVKKLKKQ